MRSRIYRIVPECLYLTVNNRTGKVDRAALWGIAFNSKTHTSFAVQLHRPDLHAVVVTKERYEEWHGKPKRRATAMAGRRSKK